MHLTREIRFSVGPALDEPVTNSWAGWPTASGVQPYLTLRATVEGTPDALTGYLCNIREIDRLLRERALPLVNRLMNEMKPRLLVGERLVRAIAEELGPHALTGTRWTAWRLYLTPFLHYELQEDDMIRVTQSFEFAAAHRLHCPALSDGQNREIFGKCNNPNGHGHNYRFEVTVAGRPDPVTGLVFPVRRLEQIVTQRVLDRLDHKHLNEDCPEFRDLNPSVEHITCVIWELLEGQFAPARLAKVRVWETAKTCAEYEGSEK